MASDWIHLERHPDDAKIAMIAGRCGASVDAVFAACVRWFFYVDRHVKSGRELIPKDVFQYVTRWHDVTLCDAMCAPGVEWLSATGDAVTVNDFDEWFSKSSKQRRLAALRQARKRSRDRHASVTRQRDKSVTRRDETRRDEKKEEPPQPPADAGGGDALVFAALREEFGLNPCDAREQRRLDRLARRLAAKANGLPPDQALQRACRGYRAIFPTAAVSPEAVLKHWDQAVKHMDGVKASEALAAEAEERKREVDAIEEKRRRECERDAAEARRRMEACSHPKAMRREDRNSDGVKLGETCACGRFLFDRSLREAEERDREMAQ